VIDSLLISSAYRGSAEGCAALLDRGANVNARDGSGRTPIGEAVLMGHSEASCLLIERGADLRLRFPGVKQTLLMVAASNGDIPTCEALIAHGCSVYDFDDQGMTALHMAASKGELATALFLIERGALLWAIAKEDLTVLHAAIMNSRDVATCRAIVKMGILPAAQVKPAGASYLTPMQYAMAVDAHAVVALFADEFGEPLEQVARDGRRTQDLVKESPAVARLLLAYAVQGEVESAIHSGPDGAPAALSRGEAAPSL
jgi:ankyrin repeat protein